VKLRQDWIDEVTSNWRKYSFYLPKPGRWYANRKAIQGLLGCSYLTSRKLENILDYQILPNQSAPTEPLPDPYGNEGRLTSNPNLPFTVNKEYVALESQRLAFIPEGVEDKARSAIFKQESVTAKT
jgi:hypothetical protein